ncbi:MAG TPA: DUF2721 domain-containing protein [Verrucomicrobiae bacterium]|jgi:ABC-type multidrug transport system fused ATPase/permease subunit|nr:DUF2721 domain-containing protein [Verrucomicrobiae bacterium]
MDVNAQSPFQFLSLIAAPALLTNATCVLAMSTINRMLRTRDRMHELFLEGKSGQQEMSEEFLEQVGRVERQARLLLHALGAIYVALGCFAGGTLMTLIGLALNQFIHSSILTLFVLVGITLVFVGVSSLIFGSARLFQATQISLLNLQAEADFLRARPAS